MTTHSSFNLNSKIISIVTCSICNCIYRNPYTISECSHSFCKVCIYNYFLSNERASKCPFCLLELGGKPLDYLIQDNSLNLLISILFPALIEKENSLLEQYSHIYNLEDNLSESSTNPETMNEEPNEFYKIKLLYNVIHKGGNFITEISVEKNISLLLIKKYILLALENPSIKNVSFLVDDERMDDKETEILTFEEFKNLFGLKENEEGFFIIKCYLHI